MIMSTNLLQFLPPFPPKKHTSRYVYIYIHIILIAHTAAFRNQNASRRPNDISGWDRNITSFIGAFLARLEVIILIVIKISIRITIITRLLIILIGFALRALWCPGTCNLASEASDWTARVLLLHLPCNETRRLRGGKLWKTICNSLM